MPLRLLIVALCAALTLPASGCFLAPEHEEGEPLREGLDIRVGGIDYTVFITRQLNPRLPDDRGYWRGSEAEPGALQYGVFLQACNRSDEDDDLPETTYEATEDFRVVDTQGNEYEPLEAEEDNVFHYRQERLAPGECIPTTGSLAQQGPTGGAMLPFEWPVATIENRPLVLEILAGDTAVPDEPDEGRVELDL